MLLELAIGDAYGAGFEFKDRAYITQFHTLSEYREHGVSGLKGYYTDDTQMTLALVELLLSRVEWSDHAIAEAFVRTFKRDPRLGYATGFQGFLESVTDGREFLQRIQPSSNRNGAAMRAVPLGVLPIDTLKVYSKRQAAVTHNTEAGILSSHAIALASHFCFHKLGPRESLVEFVARETHQAWRVDWRGEVACDALQTVHAVMTVLHQCESYSHMLRMAVDFGGDTDSVSGLSLAIASMGNLYQNDLPEWLLDDLENGPFGRDYLDALDNQFFRVFPMRG